jgi:hypothetical protein
MNIRLIPSALIISGLIAIAAPSNLSLAQSNDVGLSTSKNMMANASLHKHRYWRHRGGKHPHYGSRRIRTYRRDSANNADRDGAVTSAVASRIVTRSKEMHAADRAAAGRQPARSAFPDRSAPQ